MKLTNTIKSIIRMGSISFTGKRTALIQSNYVPWIGYFDAISKVDYFIFYDSVQFTKNDWRNRNLIINQGKPYWLSIPVGSSISRRINQVNLPMGKWRDFHINIFETNYKKFKYFEEIFDIYRAVVSDLSITSLSQLNQQLIMKISRNIFGLNTTFLSCTGIEQGVNPTENIIRNISPLNSLVYFSGLSAKNYLEEFKLTNAGIKIEFQDLSFLSNLQKIYGGSELTNLSVLDLIPRIGARNIKERFNLSS